MCLTFFRVCKVRWRWWKWHTDTEYADEIVKLQREFGLQFQDFGNLESGIKIPFEIDVELVPTDVQMEQWFQIVEECLPRGNR